MNPQSKQEATARPANYWLKISDEDFTVIYDALESRKRLFALYANKQGAATEGSVWAQKMQAVSTLQSDLLNQVPYSMNLIVSFPNGKQFVAPLSKIGQLRLRWLLEQRASPEEMHMKAAEIVSWASEHLQWSRLAPVLSSPPDPDNPYFRTMWSAGKVTITYR